MHIRPEEYDVCITQLPCGCILVKFHQTGVFTVLPLKNVLNIGLRRDILYRNVIILTWRISDYEGTML